MLNVSVLNGIRLRVSCCALLAFTLLQFVAAAAAQGFSDPQTDVDSVLALTVERLALMPDVAAWKWRHRQAISDPQRESVVLAQTSKRAGELGVDPESARAFFELQIRLARQVQERRFEKWKASGFDAATADIDLNAILRPRLDELGDKLLRVIAIALPEIKRDRFSTQSGRYVAYLSRSQLLDERDAAGLVDALSHIRSRELPLKERIVATGIVRIGMTGDYEPFSLEADNTLSGLDVELGTEFAHSLGAQARFVRTSWSSLMADYAADRFDLAMGGISITPQRSAVGRFSVAYQTGGKTPIARCAAAARFRTLEAIDRPQVKVIVNPGGTNESFVREHLHAARIVVHPDNRTIFDELLAARADVMITDDVEAELQHRRHPALCRTSDKTFTQSSKAWLLPRDAQFAALADRWLAEEVARGEVERLMRAALQGK